MIANHNLWYGSLKLKFWFNLNLKNYFPLEETIANGKSLNRFVLTIHVYIYLDIYFFYPFSIVDIILILIKLNFLNNFLQPLGLIYVSQ